ncbi:Histidine phosphatase superfamily [Naviculisporaceae sp. PSN 640]
MPALLSPLVKRYFVFVVLILLIFACLLSQSAHLRNTLSSHAPTAEMGSATKSGSRLPKYKFTAVTGYFKHDSQPRGPGYEAVTLPSLGLINKTYPGEDTLTPPTKDKESTPWERFAHHLSALNQESPPTTTYKLLYYTRHGQGYHNVKESEVGTPAWESHWARLDGDGKTVWADAHLTPLGEDQARAVNQFLLYESGLLPGSTQGEMGTLPLPTRHYVSPLTRCIQTCQLAFKGIAGDDSHPNMEIKVPPFKPVIKEMVRERLGIHTCDRRSSKSWLEKHFLAGAGAGKVFTFEPGFKEEDALWVPDVRETITQHAARIQLFLEDVFDDGEDHIVSVTAHSGSALALYEVIGHPEVRLAPGALVPILIKAERL